jgi:hypothetical protein
MGFNVAEPTSRRARGARSTVGQSVGPTTSHVGWHAFNDSSFHRAGWPRSRQEIIVTTVASQPTKASSTRTVDDGAAQRAVAYFMMAAMRSSP